MVDGLTYFDFDNCSEVELKAWLKQAIPVIKQIVTVLERVYQLNTDRPESLPCDTCDKKNQCKSTCSRLENLLPSINKGLSNHEKPYGDLIYQVSNAGPGNMNRLGRLDHSSLRAIDRPRSEEIFTFYENCKHIFTKKEWRVISLRIKAEKTYEKIGEKLGISTSTASETFRRAKRKMDNYHRKQKIKET